MFAWTTGDLVRDGPSNPVKFELSAKTTLLRDDMMIWVVNNHVWPNNWMTYSYHRRTLHRHMDSYGSWNFHIFVGGLAHFLMCQSSWKSWSQLKNLHSSDRVERANQLGPGPARAARRCVKNKLLAQRDTQQGWDGLILWGVKTAYHVGPQR